MDVRAVTWINAGMAGAVLLLTWLVAMPQAAAAAPKGSRCATEAELTAIAGRVLETELLVGALSCSQATQYNAFMEKFRTEQTERARTLQAMFNRWYGKGGQREFDSFITRLGNDSALRSLELQIAYCQATWDLFEEASRLSASEYHVLTSKPWIAARHNYQPCGQGNQSVTKTVKK